MKKSLFFIGTLIIFLISGKSIAQNGTEVKDASSNNLSLEGVWELVSFYNYDENGVVDTIISAKSNRQIKMYSKSKVMWSRFIEADSTDWFGYGNYSITKNTLTEALDYGSKSMNPIISERETFNFNLVLDKDKFSQIEIDEKGHPLFAENYKRIE